MISRHISGSITGGNNLRTDKNFIPAVKREGSKTGTTCMDRVTCNGVIRGPPHRLDAISSTYGLKHLTPLLHPQPQLPDKISESHSDNHPFLHTTALDNTKDETARHCKDVSSPEVIIVTTFLKKKNCESLQAHAHASILRKYRLRLTQTSFQKKR